MFQCSVSFDLFFFSFRRIPLRCFRLLFCEKSLAWVFNIKAITHKIYVSRVVYVCVNTDTKIYHCKCISHVKCTYIRIISSNKINKLPDREKSTVEKQRIDTFSSISIIRSKKEILIFCFVTILIFIKENFFVFRFFFCFC